MVIIIIRRFVRPDRVDAFIENYRKQAPINNPAFKGETLARASERSSLTATLRRLVADDAEGVTVIRCDASIPTSCANSAAPAVCSPRTTASMRG
jgi:hypothetical protein